MRLIDDKAAGTLEQAPAVTPALTEAPEATWQPNGGIAAALLAAGIGCAVFGVLVVLAELSTAVKDALTVTEGAGPLSGKGLGATVIWVVAWAGLHLVLRDREVPWRPVARATTALVAVGLITTFPPVFQLFAQH